MTDVGSQPRAAPVRVLLLEDNADDAAMLLAVLRRSGLRMEFEVVADEAQYCAALDHAAPDVVVADYHLHGYTGIDALHELHQRRLTVPFILVTGVLTDAVAAQCARMGAADYILKDRIARLPEAIEHALEEERLRLERARTLEELRASRAEYQLLFQTNPQPMFVFDFDNLRFLAVNAAAEAEYGYSAAEFARMRVTDLVPPERVAHVENVIRAQNGCITPEHGAVSNFRQNGAEIWVELQATRTTFAGRDARLVLVRNVTQRRQAEQARERAEHELAALIANSPHGIYRSAPGVDHFLAVNPAMARLLGYGTVEEVLALSLTHDVYRDARDRERLVSTITHDPHQMLEAEWRRKDGSLLSLSLHVHTHYKPDGKVDYFDTVVQDQTERRALEEQLRQAQKMEAIGRLAGGIAHDFNNLLMVMRGFAELLHERTHTASERRNVERILEASDRAARLVSQLLSFSRKQVLAPRVLDLNECMAETGKLLPRVLGEHIEVVLRPGQRLHSVKLDPMQLEQVLMNLAINARDAMPNGGKLVLETQNVTVDASYRHRHPGIELGEYVRLAISDTGCGMDEETRRHIFEPFFTTKKEGGGTGLGLATVYGIVRQSGGFIWVYSEPGQGTTFKLYFPAVLAPAERIERGDRLATSEGGYETVLVVEDEDGIRDSMTEFLRRRGYSVLSAANGAEALAATARFNGRIDLMVTDVVMPGMNGRVLAEQLRQHRPETRVLFISGYTGSAIADQMALAASAAFLEKPFTWEAFARKVREVLEQPAVEPAAALSGA
jgi:PAS domain S-box-containing protein